MLLQFVLAQGNFKGESVVVAILPSRTGELLYLRVFRS